jgi:hypothetical protein
MGILVNLAQWRKKKEDEEHEREMSEIRALRARLDIELDELGDVVTGPYHMSENERDSWAKRAIEVMMPGLDGYSQWPIDSSDM